MGRIRGSRGIGVQRISPRPQPVDELLQNNGGVTELAFVRLDRLCTVRRKHVVVALSEFEALGVAFVSRKRQFGFDDSSGGSCSGLSCCLRRIERADHRGARQGRSSECEETGARGSVGLRLPWTPLTFGPCARQEPRGGKSLRGWSQRQHDSQGRSGPWQNPGGNRLWNSLAVSSVFPQSCCGGVMWFCRIGGDCRVRKTCLKQLSTFANNLATMLWRSRSEAIATFNAAKERSGQHRKNGTQTAGGLMIFVVLSKRRSETKGQVSGTRPLLC